MYNTISCAETGERLDLKGFTAEPKKMMQPVETKNY